MPSFQAAPVAPHAADQHEEAQMNAIRHSVDEKTDWAAVISDIFATENMVSPLAPGVLPEPIPLSLPDESAAPIDWEALGVLPPIPDSALALSMQVGNGWLDGFEGSRSFLKSPPLPLPMPAGPSRVHLGKRKREDSVSEAEEENAAGPSRLAAPAMFSNLGFDAQGYNNITQSTSSTSTDDRDKGESTDSTSELQVPAWIGRSDALIPAAWRDTHFANRWRGMDGRWKVACLVCGKPIGASARQTQQGPRERPDHGHEHRVPQGGVRRTPCAGMRTIGASYRKGNRGRVGYKHDGLERLALVLVRRYPILLDLRFQHGQMGSILRRDLQDWLEEPDGVRLLAMRAQNPSADLWPTIDQMAAALEV